MSVVEIRSYVGEPSRIGSAAFDHVRPVDGTVIGRIFEAGPEGVEAAVRLASLVYQANRKTPLHQRVAWLQAAAAALTANADEIAALICEDVGKPIRSARFEVRRGADFLLGCASALSQMNGDVLPLDSTATGEGRFGFTRRVPYGVVAGITPFNAPVNLLVQKVGPAIAAGNAIIVKPAPAGTRTALKLAELFEQAGWPAGLYIVLAGDRPTARRPGRPPARPGGLVHRRHRRRRRPCPRRGRKKIRGRTRIQCSQHRHGGRRCGRYRETNRGGGL